jgi:hypothetical protein
MASVSDPGFGIIPGTLIRGYGTTVSNLFSGRIQTVQMGLAVDFTLQNHAAHAAVAQSVIPARRLKLEKAQME